MRKLLVSIILTGSLCSASSASAENSISSFLTEGLLESGLIDKGLLESELLNSENWNTEVFSAALNAVTETSLAEWFEAYNTSSESSESSADDPLEKYNRMMFDFNSKLDELALKPLAENYVEYTPPVVRSGVRNFFSNIGDVGVVANSALQGKIDQALSDSTRLALNSIVGLGGVIDVATELDIEKNNEDFGQTLGVWGVPEGPYIVLPLLGPRTLRSALGTVLDTYLQVETLGSISELAGAESVVSELLALNVVDQRTRLLGKESLLEQAALDPYLFTRDAYLAYRRCKVADCDKIDYVPAAPESGGPNAASFGAELDELDMLDDLDLLED